MQWDGNGNSRQYSCLQITWIEDYGRLQSTGSHRARVLEWGPIAFSTLFMTNSLQSHHSFTALLFRVHIPIQSYGFSSSHIQTWELGHNKAEHQRIDLFKLWCWRRLLRVPWTERRLNQSILKEISPEYSLEGLMLKLQYLGHLMWTADSLKKTLMLGKSEGRRRGWHKMR